MDNWIERTDNLDPSDWEQYRAAAHEALDLALDHVRDVGQRPVWQPVPDAVKETFDADLPITGQSLDQLSKTVADNIMPYTTGNTHSRFFGWVHGTGTAGGIVADMLAAAMNANLGGRDHAPVYVERQVVDWCRQIFGFPAAAGGLLVSGTSMGTLLSLAIARREKAPETAQAGMAAGSGLVIYASKEAHNSVTKGARALGFGMDQVRSIGVDSTGGMDVEALRAAISDDKLVGKQPFCVVATAGTVNAGAFDDLTSLADLAEAEHLWLHVDGAFGGLVILSESHKHLVAGIDRAHSVAFDFHKWLHVPYSVGCMLVRNRQWALNTFSDRPDYLGEQARGLAGGNPWFCEMGVELSRGFSALKVWYCFKEHGLRTLGRMISKNCSQAEYLAQRVDEELGLELMAPQIANIVCLRFDPANRRNLSEEALDRLNTNIVIELQERGIAAPSTTKIAGRVAIRVNITNHRTERSDIDILLEAIIEIGRDAIANRTFSE